MKHIKLFEDFNSIIIAYHGGNNIKDDFDYSQIGSSQHGTIYGNGFYFTSNKEMAQDFSFKYSNGYLYTVELNPIKPLKISEQELDKLINKHLDDDNNTEEKFFSNIKNIYDCIIITDRTFGGNMKFPTIYNNFIEYVVYDKSIITILKKEKW